MESKGNLTPYQVVTGYPELRFSFTMNRLFFDHGEAPILTAVHQALTKGDPAIVSSLEFLGDSLLQYQKKSWRDLLNNDLKPVLTDISKTGNYFARVKAIEILHQLASDDVEALDACYSWLQKQFDLHFHRGNDPLLLHTIFLKLNTRYGGTWVFDYEIEMIHKLLQHPPPAMQIVGLACFKSMNADQEEVPGNLWKLTADMSQKYPFDFFEFRLAFEEKLRRETQYTYSLEALEAFIAAWQ